MGITPHALVGSLIAISVQKMFKNKVSLGWQYFIAVFLAFFSHFLLDSIPHWHYVTDRTSTDKFLQWIICDLLIAGTLIVVSVRGFTDGFVGLWNIKLLFLGAFAAVSPDLVIYLSNIFQFKNFLLQRFFKLHFFLHTRTEPTLIVGIVTQLIVMIISCLGLYFSTRRKSV